MTIKERFSKVLDTLERNMPEPKTELEYDTPFHLLLAVILSAQCTDKRVNMVTPALFAAYSTPEELASATEAEVFSYVKSVSYPNNKTRHIINAARKLVSDYNSEIPASFDELVKLPGVGRKTANVMLSVVWNKAAMAVDTHVFRVSERIGLTTNSKTPLSTEQRLVKYIPEEKLGKAHHWLILHGRYVCTARAPKCDECSVRDYCRHYSKITKTTNTK